MLRIIITCLSISYSTYCMHRDSKEGCVNWFIFSSMLRWISTNLLSVSLRQFLIIRLSPGEIVFFLYCTFCLFCSCSLDILDSVQLSVQCIKPFAYVQYYTSTHFYTDILAERAKADVFHRLAPFVTYT